jgi:hypothetical protein
MSETLLTYAVSSNPELIQASGAGEDYSYLTLTIVVSNSTSHLIDCQSITFGFLEGENSKDLFNDPNFGTSSLNAGWNIDNDGGFVTATPKTADDAKVGGEALTFILSNIKVNQQPGTTCMKITETTSDGTGTLECPLQKFPQQFEVGDLTADPVSVDYNGSTTLFWSSTGDGATYEIKYQDAEGDDKQITQTADGHPLPPSGSRTVSNLDARPTVFTLTVTLKVDEQDVLTVKRQCIVAVGPLKPVINCFNIDPNSVIMGQPPSFTLCWEIVGSSFQITANDGQGGAERLLSIPSGATSYPDTPKQLVTTYTLTVFEESGVEDAEHHGKR